MDQLEAVVQAVLHGRHGMYAVSRSSQVIGSITFALDPSVWQGSDYPKSGEVVMLSDIRPKKAGWRAHKARYVQLSDRVSGGTAAIQQQSSR